MLIRKAHVYRLCPTPEQAAALWAWIGAVRCVYNLALEQRRHWYRPGRKFNFATQCREVTALRAEFDWLREVPVHPLQQAIRDLDRAYQNWWAGRARAPSPRKRGQNDAMRFPDPNHFAFRRLSRHVGEVKLPKLGWVRLRWDRAIPGEVKNITVSRQAGVWQVAAQYEHEVADPAQSILPEVGIDRGVNVFAGLSNGQHIAPADCGKRALKALARAQRNLARKKRGSNNRRKQVRRVARLHQRVANARKDFLHKRSTDVAKSHGVVVLERLEVRNMVRSAAGRVEKPGKQVRAKAGLNRAILDQGWGMFARFLAYKLAERGGEVVEVPARNSSRECAACGHVDHADTNAAKVILKRRRGTALLPVEGGRRAPVEAGTSRRAA